MSPTSRCSPFRDASIDERLASSLLEHGAPPVRTLRAAGRRCAIPSPGGQRSRFHFRARWKRRVGHSLDPCSRIRRGMPTSGDAGWSGLVRLPGQWWRRGRLDVLYSVATESRRRRPTVTGDLASCNTLTTQPNMSEGVLLLAIVDPTCDPILGAVAKNCAVRGLAVGPRCTRRPRRSLALHAIIHRFE